MLLVVCVRDATDGLATCNDDDGRSLNQEMFGSSVSAGLTLNTGNSFNCETVSFNCNGETI